MIVSFSAGRGVSTGEWSLRPIGDKIRSATPRLSDRYLSAAGWRSESCGMFDASLKRASESSAHFRVLAISMAIVIGPTPPGTGVIPAATFSASLKATSPTSRVLPSPYSGASTRFIPTSMIVAPGFSQSPRTNSGRPTDDKSIQPERLSPSACRMSIIAPAGVQETSPVTRFPLATFPAFTTCRPSTSFSGRIDRMISPCSKCFGNGN